MAIVAVARKMMVCTCHMPRNGEPFNPSDLERTQRPKRQHERLSEESALRLLRELGYDITKASTS